MTLGELFDQVDPPVNVYKKDDHGWFVYVTKLVIAESTLNDRFVIPNLVGL